MKGFFNLLLLTVVYKGSILLLFMLKLFIYILISYLFAIIGEYLMDWFFPTLDINKDYLGLGFFMGCIVNDMRK